MHSLLPWEMFWPNVPSVNIHEYFIERFSKSPQISATVTALFTINYAKNISSLSELFAFMMITMGGKWEIEDFPDCFTVAMSIVIHSIPKRMRGKNENVFLFVS